MKISRNFLKTAGIFIGILGFMAISAGYEKDIKDQQEEKPNILWFYIEDMNPLLSSYGDTLIHTPHMDRLAENGVLFEHAFVPAPVCSPCRSAIITGTYPTTLGLHNHRSSRENDNIYLPEYVQTLPEIFRDAGYFTYNKGKEDYNFEFDMATLYSGTEENNKENWKYREKGQPFFAQIQLLGGKYVMGWLDSSDKEFFNSRNWDMEPGKAVQTLSACYPRNEIIKKHWAKHYEAVKVTDNAIGIVLDELEQDGLLDNTIIFCFSDHGCYLPRDKQFTYQGGLHVPLIISYFGDMNYLPSGERRKDLINLIDVSATALGFAGIAIPSWYESRDLFANDHQERDYIISSKDRMDFTIDRVRSVRTKDFHYIRNFMTDRPYMQPQYRDHIDYMVLMRNLHKNEELPPTIDWFYDDYRPAEELYNLTKDPDELRNVADDPEYREQLEKMRGILYDWIAETDDQGQYLEGQDGFDWLNKRDRWVGLVRNPEFDRIRIPWHEVPCHIEAEMPNDAKGIKYQITTDGDHGFETLVRDGKGGYELYVPGYPHREKGSSTGNPYSAGEKVYEIYGVESGEYVSYPVKFPDDGTYRLAIRVASEHKDTRIVVKIGEDQLKSVVVPYTGSNRSWETLNTEMDVEKGVQNIKFHFEGRGKDLVHINWIRVTEP